MWETETISLKLQATAMVCLMVATVFAATPTQTQTQAMIAAANSTVPGAYVTLSKLASQLHAASLAFSQIATANKNDGTLAKVDAIAKQNKAALTAPPKDANIQTVYKKAVKLGYRGGIGDFSRYIKALTQTGKNNAYAHGTKLGLYTVMVHAAESFEAAQNE